MARTKSPESYGAKIVSQPWRGHAVHRNFASTHATQPWLLAIDADEVIPPALRDEIIRLFEQKQIQSALRGLSFSALHVLSWPLDPPRRLVSRPQSRLWQRDRADWGDKRLHESLVVNGDDRQFEK